MYQAFLAIISLIAAIYAFVTRQFKIGIGMIVVAAVFILLIPSINWKINTDIISALAMVLYLAGALLIVYKKAAKKEISGQESDSAPKDKLSE